MMMRAINSSVEVLEQPCAPDALLKHIELCERVCYKSEDKITADGANLFKLRIASTAHPQMIEVSTQARKLLIEKGAVLNED